MTVPPSRFQVCSTASPLNMLGSNASPPTLAATKADTRAQALFSSTRAKPLPSPIRATLAPVIHPRYPRSYDPSVLPSTLETSVAALAPEIHPQRYRPCEPARVSLTPATPPRYPCASGPLALNLSHVPTALPSLLSPPLAAKDAQWGIGGQQMRPRIDVAEYS